MFLSISPLPSLSPTRTFSTKPPSNHLEGTRFYILGMGNGTNTRARVRTLTRIYYPPSKSRVTIPLVYRYTSATQEYMLLFPLTPTSPPKKIYTDTIEYYICLVIIQFDLKQSTSHVYVQIPILSE